MRDYSVASVSFGSLIGLTRGENVLKLCQSVGRNIVRFPNLNQLGNLTRHTRTISGTSCNLVSQYLAGITWQATPAAQVVRLRSWLPRLWYCEQSQEKTGKISIRATFCLRSAKLSFHLGYKLRKWD